MIIALFFSFFFWGLGGDQKRKIAFPIGHTEGSFMAEVIFDIVLKTWDGEENFRCGHQAWKSGEVLGQCAHCIGWNMGSHERYW